MIGIEYSSNPHSELNVARRSLWAAKYMLGCANREPNKYDKGFWMGVINKRRAELIKLARSLRVKKRDYRLVMVSTESDHSFVIYEKAANQSVAIEEANTQYRPHFEVDLWSVTEVMK